jgi:hypothetical protein
MKKTEKLKAKLIGSGWTPSTEAAELIAAHLGHSPLPDYVAQPLVTETALRERCAVVMVLPVLDGEQQVTDKWGVVFNNMDEICATVDFDSQGLALMAALHYVLANKSRVT